MKKMTIFLASMMLMACSIKETSPNIVESDNGTDIDDIIIIADTTENGDTIGLDTLVVTGDGDTVSIDSINIDTSGNGDQGFVIVSNRTETIHLIGGGIDVSEINGTDTVALDDIRNEIDKENMSLPLFSVNNVSIRGKAENADIAAALKDVPVVLTVSTSLPGQSEELALGTLSSGDVITFKDLHDGIELNNGLYIAKTGAVTAFEDKVKNESLETMIFHVHVEFLEPVTVPDTYELEFTIEASSKKKI